MALQNKINGLHNEINWSLLSFHFDSSNVAFHIAEPAFHTLDRIVHAKLLKMSNSNDTFK